ncbi:MAG: dTDP-4-dehydrorhamnose 3,5-epimerase [Dissulfurispiraceae bacterium]
MPFIFKELSLPGVVLITPQVFGDDRGFFIEIYKRSEFSRAGIAEYFIQDNCSRSSRHVLRGLHYQKDPAAQGKLVSCLRGTIWDVAVDIRKGSPTYGQWAGIDLSDENKRMLYIPPAFAHGFVVLSDMAEIMYKCTQEYSPENDRGIFWNDPDIKIDWKVTDPILSEKDKALPLLKDADNNFEF